MVNSLVLEAGTKIVVRIQFVERLAGGQVDDLDAPERGARGGGGIDQLLDALRRGRRPEPATQARPAEDRSGALRHRPVTFDSSQINTRSSHHHKGADQRDADHDADAPARGGVAEGGGRQQSADQREGEDAVEEAGMVVGEAAADGFGHQRIDAGEAGAHEERAGAGAEGVVGEEQDQAAEDGGEHAAHQQAAVADARQDGHGHQAPDEQEQPVEGENQQRAGRAQPDAADQEQRQPAGDRPLVAELEEQQQGEQHGAGAAEIAQRLAQRGRARLRPARRRIGAGVDPGEEAGHHRHEDQNAGDGVGVEGAGHQQGGGQAAEAVPDSAVDHGAGGIRLVVAARSRGTGR